MIRHQDERAADDVGAAGVELPCAGQPIVQRTLAGLVAKDMSEFEEDGPGVRPQGCWTASEAGRVFGCAAREHGVGARLWRGAGRAA